LRQGLLAAYIFMSAGLRMQLAHAPGEPAN